MKMKTKIAITSILIFSLSFLNFQFNLFKVVSSERFNTFQAETDQFVLDGYLNYALNDEELKLGNFYRPSIDMFKEGDKYKPREWFQNQFIGDGSFWEYKSQYGLQLKIFNLLKGDLLIAQLINTIFLSLVFTIMFLLLLNFHSYKFSLIFIIAIIFNPWITPIAKNLFFMVFSFFIPFLITMYFANKSYYSNKKLFIMLFILYISFLFKALNGYEYLTTIVLTSMIPILIFYLKNNFSFIKLFSHLFLILMTSVISFSSAIMIHANSLNEEGSYDRIYLNAMKRLSSTDPERIAYNTCLKSFSEDAETLDLSIKENKDCYDKLYESLTVSRVEVISKYLLARNLIPFLGSFELVLDEVQEKNLKLIYYEEGVSSLQKGKSIIKYYLNNISEFDIFQMLSVFVNLILSPVVFLALLITFISRIVNLDSKNLILGSFILLPPLSWFILAKGHSYITTYQLTFFIWYIPTIAYILASVLSKEKIIT